MSRKVEVFELVLMEELELVRWVCGRDWVDKWSDLGRVQGSWNVCGCEQEVCQ